MMAIPRWQPRAGSSRDGWKRWPTVWTGWRKKGAPPQLEPLRALIEHGLEQTAALWPDMERAYQWIHRAAHTPNNHDGEDAAPVHPRFNGMVGAMARHRDGAGSLRNA